MPVPHLGRIRPAAEDEEARRDHEQEPVDDGEGKGRTAQNTRICAQQNMTGGVNWCVDYNGNATRIRARGWHLRTQGCRLVEEGSTRQTRMCEVRGGGLTHP